MPKALILGKFMPLHQGHIALVERAKAMYSDLCVMVCSEPGDPIPGWQRYYWTKNAFPDLDVRHAIGVSKASIEKCVPQATEVLLEAGSKYVPLAANLGIAHRTIEGLRDDFPTKTSEIRQNPHAHWQLLPEIVRPYYIKRVALVGPESCGKSYLSEKLAAHFNTVFVEEYGRTYCEKFGMDSSPLDFAHLAGGQLYLEEEMAKKANRVLFCDTELLVTQIWSEIYFQGQCQPWIMWANHERRYDLFLLLKPDLPWVDDGLRMFEAQREWMFERLRKELECRSLPYQLISGGFEERTQAAISAVELLLS
jgi:NadR type nicotinamide-nucleotide adenylyltransferase